MKIRIGYVSNSSSSSFVVSLPEINYNSNDMKIIEYIENGSDNNITNIEFDSHIFSRLKTCGVITWYVIVDVSKLEFTPHIQIEKTYNIFRRKDKLKNIIKLCSK